MVVALLRMSLSERVIKAREYAGLTQVQLAERVSALGRPISQAAISKLEKGAEGSKYIAEIAIVCGVDPVWLSTGNGQMTNGANKSPTSHSVDQRLWESATRLADEHIKERRLKISPEKRLEYIQRRYDALVLWAELEAEKHTKKRKSE